MRTQANPGAICVRTAVVCAAAIVLLAVSAAPALARQPSFQGLGDLPGGYHQSWPTAVSADGTTVVGWSETGDGEKTWYSPFRWTQETGMEDLGSLGAISGYGCAYGVSADGSVVVGWSDSEEYGTTPFRWTEEGDMVGLDFSGMAHAVSGDGSIVVGSAYDMGQSSQEAFRWTEAGGVELLGFLPGHASSYAYDISDDGGVIVGSSSDKAFVTDGSEGFFWTEPGGMEPLGTLPGPHGNSSAALAVSGDGSAVVGATSWAAEYAWDYTDSAFRWTRAGAVVALPNMPEHIDSAALAVSADGTLVLGTLLTEDEENAFIWDAVQGGRDLQEVLTNDYGLDLTGWDLRMATGVSDDGLVIVGYGTGPNGEEAWRAVLPEPTAAVLLATAAFFLLRRRAGRGH